MRVAATGNAYYPDATVVCDQMIPDPGDPHSLSNPTVLVEVLSPSKEEYDRTDKLSDYRRIPSVQHVVFVLHDRERVDVHTRSGDGLVVRSFEAGQIAELPAIGCVLDVRDIYRDPLAQ